LTDDNNYDRLIHAYSSGNFCLDLKIVLIWLTAAIACIYVPFLNDSFLRVVFALPVVLFIPGYALIAALFPGNTDIDGIERVALSFGLSIAVVPLIGLALNYTPWGIRLDPIVISLTIFTVAMVLVAQYRRSVLPAEEQFVIPYREMFEEAKSELFSENQSRLDRWLSIILVISIIAAVATTIFVIVVPKEGEKFTEFYILGEKGMAADYPTRFHAGEEQSLIIGVGNHEYRNVTYTIETLLLDQTFDETTNTSTINRMEHLDTFTITVADNETVEEPYIFTVNNPEFNRLEFLLYDGDAPADSVWNEKRINASYRDLHLWINVRPETGR